MLGFVGAPPSQMPDPMNMQRACGMGGLRAAGARERGQARLLAAGLVEWWRGPSKAVGPRLLVIIAHCSPSRVQRCSSSGVKSSAHTNFGSCGLAKTAGATLKATVMRGSSCEGAV